MIKTFGYCCHQLQSPPPHPSLKFKLRSHAVSGIVKRGVKVSDQNQMTPGKQW